MLRTGVTLISAISIFLAKPSKISYCFSMKKSTISNNNNNNNKALVTNSQVEGFYWNVSSVVKKQICEGPARTLLHWPLENKLRGRKFELFFFLWVCAVFVPLIGRKPSEMMRPRRMQSSSRSPVTKQWPRLFPASGPAVLASERPPREDLKVGQDAAWDL